MESALKKWDCKKKVQWKQKRVLWRRSYMDRLIKSEQQTIYKEVII